MLHFSVNVNRNQISSSYTSFNTFYSFFFSRSWRATKTHPWRLRLSIVSSILHWTSNVLVFILFCNEMLLYTNIKNVLLMPFTVIYIFYSESVEYQQWWVSLCSCCCLDRIYLELLILSQTNESKPLYFNILSCKITSVNNWIFFF